MIRQMKKKDMRGFVKFTVLLFLLIFIHIHVAFAQQLNFEFDPLNALPDITCGQTTAIVEDSLGYLWIGTEEGLFRYDGKTIYPYMYEKSNPKSLPSNHVH